MYVECHSVSLPFRPPISLFFLPLTATASSTDHSDWKHTSVRCCAGTHHLDSLHSYAYELIFPYDFGSTLIVEKKVAHR